MTFRGLTFRNGLDGAHVLGGAIAATTVEVSDSTFTGNTASSGATEGASVIRTYRWRCHRRQRRRRQGVYLRRQRRAGDHSIGEPPWWRRDLRGHGRRRRQHVHNNRVVDNNYGSLRPWRRRRCDPRHARWTSATARSATTPRRGDGGTTAARSRWRRLRSRQHPHPHRRQEHVRGQHGRRPGGGDRRKGGRECWSRARCCGTPRIDGGAVAMRTDPSQTTYGQTPWSTRARSTETSRTVAARLPLWGGAHQLHFHEQRRFGRAASCRRGRPAPASSAATSSRLGRQRRRRCDLLRSTT